MVSVGSAASAAVWKTLRINTTINEVYLMADLPLFCFETTMNQTGGVPTWGGFKIEHIHASVKSFKKGKTSV
jgi:hypothetical protein